MRGLDRLNGFIGFIFCQLNNAHIGPVSERKPEIRFPVPPEEISAKPPKAMT
jgi:hypothetical protein